MTTITTTSTPMSPALNDFSLGFQTMPRRFQCWGHHCLAVAVKREVEAVGRMMGAGLWIEVVGAGVDQMNHEAAGSI